MANAQTEAMKAMMRNPKTGKLFKDALSSPIGSTSRAQVKKIFSIMGKLQSSRDGVGGPGMMMERESQPADTYGYSAAADEPQSMVVFHKLPEMNINFEGHPHESSKKSATAMDGAGGPGDAAADGTAGTGGVGDWFNNAWNTFEHAAVSTVANSIPLVAPLYQAAQLANAVYPASKPTAAQDAPVQYAANMSTVNGPAYKDPKTGKVTLVSKSFAPNMSTPNGPAYAPPTKDAPPAPIHHQGVVPQALNFIPKAIGAAATFLGSTAAGVAGAAQYIGQNAIQGGIEAFRGYDTDPVTGQDVTTGPGFTSFENTWGGNVASDMYAPWNTPATQTNPGAATAASVNAATNPTGASPSGTINFGAQGNIPTGANPDGNMKFGAPQTLGTSSSGNASGSAGNTQVTIDSVFGSSNPIGAYAADPNYVSEITGRYNKITSSGASNDAQSIQSYIHSVAPGAPVTAQMIINAANATGINPALLMSVFEQESAFGTKGVATTTMNAGNQGNTGSATKSFASWQDGVNATANNILQRMTSAGGGSTGGSAGTGGAATDVLGASSSGGTDTSGSSGSGTSGGNSAVNTAVKNNIGPTMFALQQMSQANDPVTGGLSLAQKDAQDKSSIWSQFNISGLQGKLADDTTAANSLPQDLTNYIRNQDTYLNQTDSAINSFIAANAGKQMSNTENQAYSAQLNYLYTLRGAQNQRYIDYIGSSVAMNKTDVANDTNAYTSALKNATDALTSREAMNKDTYTTYSKALSDMYTDVQKAPITAQQYQYVQSEILRNHAIQAKDAATLKAQMDFFAVNSKMKEILYDKNGFPIERANLLTDTIQQLAQSHPANQPNGIDPGTILTIYNNAVKNVLGAPSGAKDGNGQPIKKSKSAQAALSNYAQLAAMGIPKGDMTLIGNAVGYGEQIANMYGNTLGGDWGIDPATAGKARNLVSSLASKGWFGGTYAPPKIEDFINSAKTSGLDTSMAAGLYDQFSAYMKQNGEPRPTAAGFVASTLTNTETQSAIGTPWTDQELLSLLGKVASNYLYAQQLSQYGLTLNPIDGTVTVKSTGSTTSI